MDVKVMQKTPAQIYDDHFVPAVFAQWGPVVANAAGVRPGMAVLDVACGTGALTLAAARIAGPRGRVAGLDANPEMLAVARSKPSDIEWHDGTAEALPFADATFDAAVSQFGFMFFDDPARALGEMKRVLKPGGRLAVAVCDAVENAPGYAAFARLLDRLFGREIGDAFRAPFVLGDAATLGRIAADAGIAGASVETHDGTVRFRTIADLVSTERACVWTLGGMLNGDQFDLLLREAQAVLEPFTDADGAVRFSMPALILTAGKQG